MTDDLYKQMEFLQEIDKLKNIERRTKNIYNLRYENDAEHTWVLAMMALVLHQEANAEVDLLKVIKMLLVHDIVEIDAGDTFAYDTAGHADKQEREMKAAERIFGMLPQEQAEELMALWQEFENKETNEAKFAGALDRLQPMINNHLNNGDTWQKHGITSEQVIERNKEIAKGSETLWEFARDIIQKSVDQGILPER